jgi:phospholipid/cholesterol/gamma-HCH transport system ATP-binding protein
MSEKPQIDIEVRDLLIRYGDSVVLRGIDADIIHGKVTSVMGPSGCGKTTLLKAMLGMVIPDEGEIRLLGHDVIGTEREELSKYLTSVGVTFQQGALFGSMTVGENVAVPLREHTDLDEDTIRDLVQVKLGLVGMAHAVNKMPSELSGGMQKRAAIARALALDPPILFFDEPSAGLDPVTAEQLDDLILFINQSLGTTIVVVTHEVRSAMKISDDLLFLSGGKVRERGSPDTFRHSANSAVASFLACSGIESSEECPSPEVSLDDNAQ